MTNWRKMALGAVFFAFSITGLKGQEIVTLKEAIEYALQNKAEAQKAKLDIRNADYQIMEAKSGALPQINGPVPFPIGQVATLVALNCMQRTSLFLRLLLKHWALRVANITSSQAPAKQLCSLPSWHDDP